MFTEVTENPHAYLVCTMSREGNLKFYHSDLRQKLYNIKCGPFKLTLDSRTRTSNNVHNTTFQLTKPISRCIKLGWNTYNSFANTLYNVGNGENVLVLSTGSLTVPPGFYSPAEFVALLQTICTVTYNIGKLTWTLVPAIASWLKLLLCARYWA